MGVAWAIAADAAAAGAAVVGAQLPVVFSHYFGVFILNAFSLVIVFIRRISTMLFPLPFSLYLYLHCVFVFVFVVLFGEVAGCNCNDWIFMNTFIKALCNRWHTHTHPYTHTER